jgi:hypothetical protein
MPPKSAAAPREQRPRGRTLRSIPGGYDIDRWPICVPIRPHETVPSWLMRAALRYGITPRALLAKAGADGHIDRPGQFAAAVSRHTDQLVHLLGCAPDEVHTAVRRIHPNTALSDYVQRYKGLWRAVLAGSSYVRGACPNQTRAGNASGPTCSPLHVSNTRVCWSERAPAVARRPGPRPHGYRIRRIHHVGARSASAADLMTG